MKIYQSKILEHKELIPNIYFMNIQFSETQLLKPGQFIHIQIPSKTLRRPISICSIQSDSFSIIYRVVGEGTAILSTLQVGDEINFFAPLGNGFPIDPKEEDVLCVGGGIGIPPLYEVAKRYQNMNKKVTIVLGFQSKKDIFYIDEFKALGTNVIVSTMDGSYGYKGNVMDVILQENLQKKFVYACGPNVMLKEIEKVYQRGYLSFESRMACGFGVCMGCTCKDKKDKQKHYRICKEGPVFEIGKVDF